MELADILKRLHDTGKLSEMAQATTYQGLRHDEEDEDVFVTVTVLDYGPEAPESRYLVFAEDVNGATAEGDAAASVEEAIDLVPWDAFIPEEEEEDDEDA